MIQFVEMAQIPVSTGVTKEILVAGQPGAKPVTKNSSVTVHCKGMLTEGMVKFWSTRDPGQSAFTFNAGVGQVCCLDT